MAVRVGKTDKTRQGYLTGREIREIAKANAKEIKRLEGRKSDSVRHIGGKQSHSIWSTVGKGKRKEEVIINRRRFLHIQ